MTATRQRLTDIKNHFLNLKPQPTKTQKQHLRFSILCSKVGKIVQRKIAAVPALLCLLVIILAFTNSNVVFNRDFVTSSTSVSLDQTGNSNMFTISNIKPEDSSNISTSERDLHSSQYDFSRFLSTNYLSGYSQDYLNFYDSYSQNYMTDSYDSANADNPSDKPLLPTSSLTTGSFGTSNVLGSKTSSLTSGTITTSGSLRLYLDSQCTILLSDLNWGSMNPGGTVTRIAYLKNLGTSDLALSLSTSNWNPTIANGPITINWDKEGEILAAGQSIQTKITLTVSNDISGISTFSTQILISGASY